MHSAETLSKHSRTSGGGVSLPPLRQRQREIISSLGPMPRAAVSTRTPPPALELAEINREIVATRSTIAEIDRVLAQLDDADAELLRAWYIEHKSKEQIADELSYSSKTSIYDLRNKAVAAFAVLYYGAGALASI